MKTVSEISRLTGVSIKALHHYDKIGLLKPDCVTDAGYRLYGEKALTRLNSILIFRELRFPLKEIREILDTPEFDPKAAIERQISLLDAERKRIERIIQFARKFKSDGGTIMDYAAFDHAETENLKKEARDRWGDTEAYTSYEEKAGKGHDFEKAGKQLMEIFASIGTLKALSPEDPSVQAEIKRLQAFISENFYPCTNEILKGLGQMYVCDERFKANIDQKGGEGTAEFAAKAIDVYVKR